ncbi:MAG: tRNA pseudouridine(55) synthase TruB [Bacteroidales bacterium]|nr:tRNA pseudouridine(55) synthase TruB [Bacteroidales bacterium]
MAVNQGLVLCINKPLGWTSADVVRKVRFRLQRLWNIKKIKVGHAGTLDPLATGLLILCVGKATRLANLFQAQEKEYHAGIKFGATTVSYDLEHPIDATYPWKHIDRAGLLNILDGFLGKQLQLPPVYSAKVIDGTRAYELARQGVEIPEMKKNSIEIYALEIMEFSPPQLLLKIKCSKGTYIRSLARDLGEALNSGAHLISLHRSQSGEYKSKNAFSMEEFEILFH